MHSRLSHLEFGHYVTNPLHLAVPVHCLGVLFLAQCLVQHAAWRRRQRRLRSWWRHEQQSVAMALSAAAHQSYDKVAAGAKYDGLRAQTTDRERREVEERDLHDAPRRQKPPPPGTRPAPWLRCGRRRVRVALRQRLRACSRCHSAEAWERTGGSAERCFSGEQNVDIPVHGGGRFQIPLGGLQGSRPGQGSIVHAMPALAVEYISPAQTVSRSPAPVIEYFSLAPAVFQAPACCNRTSSGLFACASVQWFYRQLWNLLHPR